MTDSRKSPLADEWAEADESDHLPDPDGCSEDEAVFIGSQATGDTIVIGRENDGEWISTTDMAPITVVDRR